MLLTKLSLFCPTYNEKENIAPLIARIIACQPRINILFVDDMGDDGTVAEIMRQAGKNVHLLTRPEKQGLGSAYLAGFAWGLARGFSAIITMDADLSHDPIYLQDFLRLLPTCDVVVGSRYVVGGATRDWKLTRRLLSAWSSIYARTVLRIPVRDPTSGYVGFSRQAIERLDISGIKGKGFVFQVEIKYRAVLAGCKIAETPIMFTDRLRGQSKISLGVGLEAAIYVWQLRRKKN